MKYITKILLSYLLISFNSFIFALENKDKNFLKIGVLAPFSGELKGFGEEILYSINLALHDIDDSNIKIYPKDSGSENKKIKKACEEFEKDGIKVVVGPVESKSTKDLYSCENLIFLSLSNMDSNIKNNVLMMGINLESQLISIKKFINKENRKKTIILYPENDYSKHIEKNIKLINFPNSKKFKYSQNPEKLTKQIEKLTNYKQRKMNLESRVKKLEGSEELKDIRELNKLKQRYTLGKVNFDSVIILDFGDSLKSVLTSLAYTDVADKDILIITGNQWFDKGILEETSINNFYFPSINLNNFRNFNKSFFKVYNYIPNEISILAYDSVGLIYYLWKNLGAIKSINDFNFKKDIKGKLGKFKISENKVIQDLNIYRIKEGKFIQNKF